MRIADDLPRLRMTADEFRNLPEYSASLPSGTTPGKMWRRLDGDFDLAFKAGGGQPRWMIGQYDPDCPEDAERIRILWFRPIITYRAAMPEVRFSAKDRKPDTSMVTFESVHGAYSIWRARQKKDPNTSGRFHMAIMALKPEIIDWLKVREITPRVVVLNFVSDYCYVGFHRSDEAFEFKMAWG